MIFNRSFINDKSGARLDAALVSLFPTTSRAFVKDAIAAGKVKIGETVTTNKGLKLRGGERITVVELAETNDNTVMPSGKCPAPIFEDAALLAFDKPCGMPVQPLSRTETGTLMNAVVTRYPECIPLGDRPLMAGALHRIDADTSGLVLVARSEAAFKNLREQFSAQTVKKTYLALVEGSVAVGGTLENDLVHDPTLPFCRMIDIRDRKITSRMIGGVSPSTLKPLHAVTRFVPIAHTTVENEERTLLEVTIFTGVTHQIRAQLALAGMHIVNDRLYGAFAIENQVGHCLHALAAAFMHPICGDPVEIRTSVPEWVEGVEGVEKVEGVEGVEG